MTRFETTARTAFITMIGLAIASCSSGPPPQMPTPSAAWDPGQVTAIARDLAQAVQNIYVAEYEAADVDEMPAAAGGGDEQAEFRNTIVKMKEESDHLADELAHGASAHTTFGSIERLKELNDDLQEYGRGFGEDDQVKSDFSAVEDQLRKLAPFYGYRM